MSEDWSIRYGSTNSVLEQADKLINGERQKAYGDPKDNLSRVAEQWNMYLHQKTGMWPGIAVEDVCWMMTLLKMCRQMHKADKENLVDAAGYIGLVEKVT